MLDNNLIQSTSSWPFVEVRKLLKERKFDEGIKNLQILSEQNDINAQLLYSKILFSGDLTPQDFENSYFWGFSALLGGLKKSSSILEKLNEYLTEEQISEITNKLRDFLRDSILQRKTIVNCAASSGHNSCAGVFTLSKTRICSRDALVSPDLLLHALKLLFSSRRAPSEVSRV